MTGKRWLIVVAGLAFLALVEALSDSLLDAALPFPRDTLLVVALLSVTGIIGAFLAFRTIDRLTDELRGRNRDLERRNATARALHRVSLAVSASPRIDDVLDAIVRNACALLGADVALLVLFRADGEPRLTATAGDLTAIVPDPELPGRDGDEIARFVRPGKAPARLAAPLQRGDRMLGTLAVGSATARSFGVDDVETLSSLANQAAIALDAARLQEQLRELAVEAERERIAREMHDGLAQVLGYVNTKSQAVDELLASGRIDDARAQMADLAAASRSVYVDVREAILGLSSPIMPGPGLVGSLEVYVERFGEASKLAARVEATPEARAVDLPPAACAQVFRIVQEALTNVRKHASANRVVVGVAVEEGRFAVTVEDDGRGFDPSGPEFGGWPHFGLESMRSRAAELDGTIDWRPGAERGTRLRLSLPLPATPGPALGPDETTTLAGVAGDAPGKRSAAHGATLDA